LLAGGEAGRWGGRFHFPAGNALALASLLRRLAQNPLELGASLTGSPAVASRLGDFVSLYQNHNSEGHGVSPMTC
jgi:hypothetical protein